VQPSRDNLGKARAECNMPHLKSGDLAVQAHLAIAAGAILRRAAVLCHTLFVIFQNRTTRANALNSSTKLILDIDETLTSSAPRNVRCH
jgi:hypothetical protein